MNRRQLLQLMTCALGATAGSSPTANQIPANKRLVLVELAGANDGLNTLIPFSNNYYQSLRPTIGLSRRQMIELTDDIAIHQALKPLMSVWNRGQLAWIQGLGYPNPNRSHFKSIALWETGGDGIKQRRAGWVTHDIEHKLGRTLTDAHGISLTEDMNLFSSDSGRWLSMTSPEQFKNPGATHTPKVTLANDSIAMVTRRINELEHSLHGLSSKLDNTTGAGPIAGGAFGYQLRQVSRLIKAGLDTPIYRVKLDGFDTHEYQLYRHHELLSELAAGLSGFQQVLQADNEWQNTLIVTYSEFGRRVWENKSHGTDHGTAAPHFIMGGAINGGLYGTAPVLESLGRGEDPEFTMDYRALYSQIFSSWFEIDNNTFYSFTDHRLHNVIRATG